VKSNVKKMGRIDKITIHHSGSGCFWAQDASQAAGYIHDIQRFHQKQRGWADIGYHYIVDRSGHVWQGRPLTYQGAHAGGVANRGNIGIAVLGNYCHQRLTSAQRRTLLLLLAKLSSYFSIPPSRIYTHREIGRTTGHSTDCPGPELSRFVRDARETLRSLAYRGQASPAKWGQ
jgi:hypothetical protein